MKKISIYLIVILSAVLSSCSSDGEGRKEQRILASSSGRVNEMVVVMKHDLWKGPVGKEVRAIFGEDIVGLPQPEPLYRVAHIDPANYTNVFKNARSILVVKLDDGTEEKARLSIDKNVYAQPQVIETLSANTPETIIKALRKYKNDLRGHFHDQDIKSVQKRYKKIARYDIPKLKENGISIVLPKSYMKVELGEDFWWYRSDIKEGKVFPALNFILYVTPLNSEMDLNGQNIIAIRDSIAKKYIAGPTEGSFMQTEPRPLYAPVMENTVINGQVAIETRGLWMVKNDFMGGPFLSYTIFDEENDRIVTAEGFIYAAGTKKRDYIFEIESIIKSLKLN